MTKQSRVRHAGYMRVWRRRKKHGLTGKVPKEELEKEITKIKREEEVKKLREQGDLKETIRREQREKILGIHVPESTKPKDKNPFDLPFYEQEKERKEEIVYQKVSSRQFDFLKDFFSGKADESILDKERKIGKLAHERPLPYEVLMKLLEEDES